MPLATKPASLLYNPSGVPDSNYYAPLATYNYQLQEAGTVNSLFDGNAVNEWNTDRVCYFVANDFVEVETDVTANLYRAGTTTWDNLDYDFTILGWDGGDYTIDFTSYQVTKPYEANEQQWVMFVQDLPAGRYRFTAITSRIDSEWWIADSSILLEDYLTFNPARGQGNYTEGSKRFESTDSIINDYVYCLGVQRDSGKYYFEFEMLNVNTPTIGLLNTNLFDITGRTYNSIDAITVIGTDIWHNGVSVPYGSVYEVGSVVGFVCDFDSGNLIVNIDNVSQGVAPYSLNLIDSLPCVPFISSTSSHSRPQVRIKVSTEDQTYAPPAGYVPWVDVAIPPTVGNIKLGTTDVTSVALGANTLSSVYLGTYLIWEN